MKKVIIDFKMISLDSKVEFTTSGELFNQEIVFIDEELSTHNILFIDNTIEYTKKGLMDMKFLFDINNKTLGTYVVDKNSFVFDIITTELDNASNRLVIKYDLIQNNEMVNRSTLTIKYSIAKEE